MSTSFYERNQKVLANKAQRRRELAQLPFEEKLKMLVRLQEIAYKIKQDERYKPLADKRGAQPTGVTFGIACGGVCLSKARKVSNSYPKQKTYPKNAE